jgi:lysozyme family protein
MQSEILEQSYKWEVGFDTDPDDLGGATKDGITFEHFRANAAKVLGKPPLWRIFISMSKEDILKFYERIYIRVQCDKIQHPAIAAACFDFALNSANGKREIQEVLRDEFNKPIAIDNIFGTQTVGALNQVTAAVSAVHLLKSIMDKRQKYVEDLTIIKPSQKKFLDGWMHRINDMRLFCQKLIEENDRNSKAPQ